MAHVRVSRPDSGLGFQVKVLKPFQGSPSSLRRAPDYQLCAGSPFLREHPSHTVKSEGFNFGTRQILSRYLRLPTPKIRVYMLVKAYNDAILRLFMCTDSGMFRDEFGRLESSSVT